MSSSVVHLKFSPDGSMFASASTVSQVSFSTYVNNITYRMIDWLRYGIRCSLEKVCYHGRNPVVQVNNILYLLCSYTSSSSASTT